MSFSKTNNTPQNTPNTSIKPISNSTLQTIDITSLTMNNTTQISHHNILGPFGMDTILLTNRNLSKEISTPSPVSMFVVNELLAQLRQKDDKLKEKDELLKQKDDKLKAANELLKQKDNTIKQQSLIIQQTSKTINQQDFKIKKKDELLEKKNKIIEKERSKKRELISFVSERGLYTTLIGQAMGTFEYSAEIRGKQIHKITDLFIGQTEYILGTELEGEKTFHFTNSANVGTELVLSDLALVSVPPKKEKEEKGNDEQFTKNEFKFVNEDKYDFNYDDNCVNINNCDQKNNKFKSKKNENESNDVIYPGDYFYVTFKHPIIQKIGKHKLAFRLFSYTKANDSSKQNANGMFGQRIEFSYQVKGPTHRN